MPAVYYTVSLILLRSALTDSSVMFWAAQTAFVLNPWKALPSSAPFPLNSPRVSRQILLLQMGLLVLYCIVLYCIVLYCIVLYCIVLYCIVLYCIVLYCIVLYWVYLYSATLNRISMRFTSIFPVHSTISSPPLGSIQPCCHFGAGRP